MTKVKIDPSIVVGVDIGPVSFNEDLNVYFTASENLTGAFEAKYYNSPKKNTEIIVVNNPLTIVEKVLTFRIAPSIQQLGSGEIYYEIWHTTSKRLFFNGQITIGL